MKMVKKSITVTKEEFKYLEEKAERIARERGGPVNVSAVIRQLLADARNRQEGLKRAA